MLRVQREVRRASRACFASLRRSTIGGRLAPWPYILVSMLCCLFAFAVATPEQRTAQLDLIIKQARSQDALTLWHLLLRVNAGDRERVYERFSALVPPPQGITREGILRLDQRMLDAWWSKLGYGDVSLWRTFERSWSQTEPRVE